MARLLRRSLASVQRMARKLFARDQRVGLWSAAEDLVLRNGFGILSMDSLALILARPEVEISKRIAYFKASLLDGPWDPREELRFKKLYGCRSDADLVVCFSRSLAMIREAAERLCLSKDKKFLSKTGDGAVLQPMPRWSREEIITLQRIYPQHDNLEVARQLGRSVASVANKASQLGLRKSSAALQSMGRRNIAVRYRR